MSESFFEENSEKKASGTIPGLDSENEEASGSTGSSDKFRTEDGRMAAMMSYIPFLCFVPLLNMKDNPEARFHARQGLILFLIELIAVLFLIDGISDFVFKAILVVAAALSVAGIWFALQGKNYRLPILGDLADRSKL
jgi:uncharacterized membrane protein